jgi:hypothetical protein
MPTDRTGRPRGAGPCDLRSALAGAVHAILGHVGDERVAVELESAERTRMIHLATLAVRCRSAVERDGTRVKSS